FDGHTLLGLARRSQPQDGRSDDARTTNRERDRRNIGLGERVLSILNALIRAVITVAERARFFIGRLDHEREDGPDREAGDADAPNEERSGALTFSVAQADVCFRSVLRRRLAARCL